MRLEYSISAQHREVETEPQYSAGRFKKLLVKFGRNWMGMTLLLIFGTILVMSVKHDQLFLEELLLGGGIALGLMLLHLIKSLDKLISEN